MIEEIRELFQTLIAPQLESIKGDIRGLDAKINALDQKFDAKIDSQDGKFEAKFNALLFGMDSMRRELLSEIGRVHGVLSADFGNLEDKVDLRLEHMDTKLGAMNEKLDFHRRELLAEIRAALK